MYHSAVPDSSHQEDEEEEEDTQATNTQPPTAELFGDSDGCVGRRIFPSSVIAHAIMFAVSVKPIHATTLRRTYSLAAMMKIRLQNPPPCHRSIWSCQFYPSLKATPRHACVHVACGRRSGLFGVTDDAKGTKPEQRA